MVSVNEKVFKDVCKLSNEFLAHLNASESTSYTNIRDALDDVANNGSKDLRKRAMEFLNSIISAIRKNDSMNVYVRWYDSVRRITESVPVKARVYKRYSSGVDEYRVYFEDRYNGDIDGVNAGEFIDAVINKKCEPKKVRDVATIMISTSRFDL